MSDTTGIIFDIKRFAVHDGPGIRTTLFFKGCPLSCWWCHNPEGISLEPEMIHFPFKCIHCKKCIDICVQNALSLAQGKIERDYVRCISCGSCSTICPSMSQQMIGQKYTVDDVMSKIENDHIFYHASSGGVTFSGGEPLLQHGFLKELLRKCGKKGFHTAIDTSGYTSPSVFNELIEFIDLFLFDLKIVNNECHKRYVGVSNKSILSNLSTLDEMKKQCNIRFTVIPGISDTDANIKDTIEVVSSFDTIHEISLLPFHNVSEKYERLGKKYKLNNLPSPSIEHMGKIKTLFERKGFHVTIGK